MRPANMKHAVAVMVLLAAGCASSPPSGDAAASSPGSDAGAASSPEVPPQGQQALEAWLATGAYKGWHCEAQISPSRGGAHGSDRICTNDLLHAAPAPPFPLGSASVAEMFDAQGRTNGYAVSVKVAAGSGDSTWYWYERAGSSPTSRPVADTIAHPVCADCHSQSPTDNVYIVR
jgi:hypothetical protein